MKKNFLGMGLIALAFVMLASQAMATPVACDTLSGTDVAAGGMLANSITCTEGGLIFSNFQYSVASGSGTPMIDLGGATASGGNVDINFNPNLGYPNLVTDLHFTFTVTGFISGTDLENAGLLSSVQETTCSGTENLNGHCSANVLWNTADIDNQYTFCDGNTAGGTGVNGTCAYGAGVTNISVFKDILIGAGGHQSSFTESFATNPSGVPEPVTMSLMGIGLLGIGLLGRRIRK